MENKFMLNQDQCLQFKIRKKRFWKKKTLLFAFVVGLFFCSFFKSNILYFVKPWEKSVAGDFDACSRIAPILLEKRVDESQKSSKIFSWQTPRFVDIVLLKSDQEKDTSITKLIAFVCKQFIQKKEPLLSLADLKLQEPLLTSPYHTYFKIISKKQSYLGDDIKLLIQARDSEGKNKAYGGGDFFKIRAENPETKSSVAAASIEQQENGVYVVTIKTFWTGRHDIKAVFGQSGHFIDLVKRMTSRNVVQELKFQGQFNSDCKQTSRHCVFGSSRQFKLCAINNLRFDKSIKLCNYSKSKGEEWYCEQPIQPLTCSNLHAVFTQRSQTSLALFRHFPLHDRGTTKRIVLQGFPRSLNVLPQKEKTSLDEELSLCGPNLRTPSPSGYWLNGVWRSRVCQNTLYSQLPEKMKDCLRNRVFYFLGDSTARQWFEHFLDASDQSSLKNFFLKDSSFEIKEITSVYDVWEPRTAVMKVLNATFHYRSHGTPVQNGGLWYANKFISTTIDEIPSFDDKGYQLTVVIAVGPHFLLYKPDVFLERILAIRDAGHRLLVRNPKATIIFKGTSTFNRGVGIGECCYTDWLSFRQNKLAKHVFDGTSIVYLDVWDMTVSHPSEDLIHPVREVVTNEIDMALSFACSSSK